MSDRYLAALRELAEQRRTRQLSAEAHTGRLRMLRESIDDLRGRLDTQRAELNRLAHEASLPPVPTHPSPSARPADPAAELRSAATEIEAADTDLAQARYLAHRPALLPAWRADERNGLVYGGFALVSLVVQALILTGTMGEPFSDRLDEFALCVVLPFAAFGAAWLSIGVVSRPRLGGEEHHPLVRLPRNPRLGLVVCLSTWLVSWWLGTVYLT